MSFEHATLHEGLMCRRRAHRLRDRSSWRSRASAPPVSTVRDLLPEVSHPLLPWRRRRPAPSRSLRARGRSPRSLRSYEPGPTASSRRRRGVVGRPPDLGTTPRGCELDVRRGVCYGCDVASPSRLPAASERLPRMKLSRLSIVPWEPGHLAPESPLRALLVAPARYACLREAGVATDSRCLLTPCGLLQTASAARDAQLGSRMARRSKRLPNASSTRRPSVMATAIAPCRIARCQRSPPAGRPAFLGGAHAPRAPVHCARTGAIPAPLSGCLAGFALVARIRDGTFAPRNAAPACEHR